MKLIVIADNSDFLAVHVDPNAALVPGLGEYYLVKNRLYQVARITRAYKEVSVCESIAVHVDFLRELDPDE